MTRFLTLCLLFLASAAQAEPLAKDLFGAHRNASTQGPAGPCRRP